MDSPANPKPSAEALFKHADFLARLAMGLIGDSHAAADLVQDAYVTALEHPPREQTNLGAWLGRVVRNRAFDVRSQNSNRALREKNAVRGSSHESSSVPIARIELQRQILDALLALPESQRSTIYLRYYEGLTPTAIAERQSVPVKTVQTRLSRGLASLRSQLDQNMEGDRQAWLSALAPIALLAGSKRPTGLLATTKIGAGSIAGLLGALVMKKVLLAAVALIAAMVGWRSIGGTAVRPALSEVVKAEFELAQPVTAEAVDRELVTRMNRDSRETVLAGSTALSTSPELGSLRLRLTWSDGTPAVGVDVIGRTTGVPSDRETDHTGVSDGEGVLLLTDLFPGEFNLRTARGYRKWDLAIVAGETTEFTWSFPAGVTVRGRVVDLDERPVADAQIWMSFSYDWPYAACVARTNSTGSFVVLGVSDESAKMGARGRGLLPANDYEVSRMPLVSDGVREFTFVMGEPAGGIVGTVLDPQGEPVSGALVHAGYPGGSRSADMKDPGESSARLVSVTSDAEGRFALPGGYAPDRGRRDIPIHAQARGYPTWSGRVTSLLLGVVDFEIQLSGGATVAGQVTDSLGRPVSNARVAIASSDSDRRWDWPFPIPIARTDTAGNYRLEFVPPGRQQVSAIGEDERLGRDLQQGNFPDGETTKLDLRLDPNPVVSGFLVDAEGRPLVGWRLEASFGFYSPYRRRTETDDSGAFLLSNVGDDSVELKIYRQDQWFLPNLTTWVEPGTEGLQLVIEDTDVSKGYLTGIMLNRDGSGPAKAELLVYSKQEPTTGLYSEFDQETGRFRYGPVAVGMYRFAVIDENEVEAIGDWVEVVADETVDVGELRRSATGRVELVLSEVPLDKAARTSIRLEREYYWNTPVEWEDDRLLSGEVPVGNWTIISGGELFFPPTPVEVLEGKTQVIQLDVRSSYRFGFKMEFANDEWSTVSYSVTDVNGELLSRRSYNRTFLESGRKYSSDSSCQIVGLLPLGWVNVELATDNGLIATARLEVSDSPAGQEWHTLRLE